MPGAEQTTPHRQAPPPHRISRHSYTAAAASGEDFMFLSKPKSEEGQIKAVFRYPPTPVTTFFLFGLPIRMEKTLIIPD